jgi:hypothetical protein
MMRMMAMRLGVLDRLCVLGIGHLVSALLCLKLLRLPLANIFQCTMQIRLLREQETLDVGWREDCLRKMSGEIFG